jgi:hypothetical protein
VATPLSASVKFRNGDEAFLAADCKAHVGHLGGPTHPDIDIRYVLKN